MTFEEWWEANKHMLPNIVKIDARFTYEAATKAEREACAKVCDTKANENADKWEGDEAKAASWMMLQCAAAIRARSNHPTPP